MSSVEPGATVTALIARLLAAQSDCIRALYLEGGQADDSATATNDTDPTTIVAKIRQREP